MDHSAHNGIVSFIWNIADDVLRDVYVRGKYRDVILPMTVIRRLDALLESTKDLNNWLPVGDPFVANDESIVVELDVDVVGRLFRIRQL